MDIHAIYALFLEKFGQIPLPMRNGLVALLIGYGAGNLFYLLANLLYYPIARMELQLNQRKLFSKRRSEGDKLMVGAAAVSHPVFQPDLNSEDIWGIATFNWNMIYILAIGAGLIIGYFSPGDQLSNVAYGLLFGAGGVYGFRKFFTYIRKLKTTKDTMDLLNMLQNEITVQHNSLNRALNQIRINYFNHVNEFGEKSWYYKNYPLSRLVYLISVTPSFIPSSILKQLGDELGEVDALRKVMANALGRIGQTGDAGTVLKEMIEAHNQEYMEQLREKIPQYSDKLFYPIMATHFMPFLIVILWPMVEAINSMMTGTTLTVIE